MKKNGRKKVLLMAGLAVLIFLAGCSEGATASVGKKIGNDHIPIKFGATYMTMDNPYFVALNDRIKEEVESNGDILITRDPAKDQKKQNEQILEMLDSGVTAIFLNPVDWKEVTPALESCYVKNIPIFIIDTYVYESKYVTSSITSDNYDAGVQIAKDVMKKLNSARVVIMYEEVVNSTELRVQGFIDTLTKHDEYRIVMRKNAISDLETSMEKMKGVIYLDLDFNVLLGSNDPTALGMLAALQLNHISKKNTLIYGIDGSPNAKAMIKDGMLEGSSAQFPYKIGSKACEIAYQYLAGEAVEKEIIIPVELITRDNLSEYDVTGWQ